MDQIYNYLLVGNTRLHWAEIKNNNYLFSHTLTDQPLPDNVNLETLIWASVGNYSTEIFKKENQITTNKFNLKNLPKHFGVDRALCCLAALKTIDNPLKKNLLIADFGTVLSLTKVNFEGNIIGGQLMPGFLTQLKSMEKYAKNLACPSELIIPSNNYQIHTSKAMIRGVHNALLGAINMSFNNNKDILIICGGDAELMSKSLKKISTEIIMEPNLVMLGMILFKNHI